MRKITLKQLLFVILCLFITTNTIFAHYGTINIKPHQNGIITCPGSNVDFKFDVISDGGSPITTKKAYFRNYYGENRIDDPYKIIDQVDGRTYYYIKLFNVQKSCEGRYKIELINKAGYSGISDSYLVIQ